MRFQGRLFAPLRSWALDVRHSMFSSHLPLTLLLAAVLCLLSSVACRADAILASQTWNTAGLNNWTDTVDQTWVSLENPMAGGNTGGFLSVSLASTDPFNEGLGEEWWANVGTSATNIFAGSWTNTGEGPKWIEFDFFASNVVPGFVQVVWYSTNSRVWRNTVFDKNTDSMSLSNWATLSTDVFGNYSDWDYGDGTQQQFLDDLGAIDWIGIYIWRNTASEQMYGIDNFQLWVPEPCELALLAAAGFAALRSLRRRKRQKMRGRGLVTGHRSLPL